MKKSNKQIHRPDVLTNGRCIITPHPRNIDQQDMQKPAAQRPIDRATVHPHFPVNFINSPGNALIRAHKDGIEARKTNRYH